jgi:hypothetical protein
MRATEALRDRVSELQGHLPRMCFSWSTWETPSPMDQGDVAPESTQMIDEWNKGCPEQLEVSSASGPQQESRLLRAPTTRGKVAVLVWVAFPPQRAKRLQGTSLPCPGRGGVAVVRHPTQGTARSISCLVLTMPSPRSFESKQTRWLTASLAVMRGRRDLDVIPSPPSPS